MSVRPRKKIEMKISQNKAYQVILKPLVTEKSTQLSEYNKMVFVQIYHEHQKECYFFHHG